MGIWFRRVPPPLVPDLRDWGEVGIPSLPELLPLSPRTRPEWGQGRTPVSALTGWWNDSCRPLGPPAPETVEREEDLRPGPTVSPAPPTMAKTQNIPFLGVGGGIGNVSLGKFNALRVCLKFLIFKNFLTWAPTF